MTLNVFINYNAGIGKHYNFNDITNIKNAKLEELGIDPSTSRMLSERSTI
jgi:hypothetical protein